MKRNSRTIGAVLLITLQIALAMIACVQPAEGKATDTEGKVVNIYGWGEQFKELYEIYGSDLPASYGVTVNFVLWEEEGESYQQGLEEALLKQEEAPSEEKIDMFLVETEDVKTYATMGRALDLLGEVGLTSKDLSGQYPYTQDLATIDGVRRASALEATPALFVYRRSIAEKVLHTQDPKMIGIMMRDWERFDEMVQLMKEHNYIMASGVKDLYKNHDQQEEIFGFFCTPKELRETLAADLLAEEKSQKDSKKGAYGDYAVCMGPTTFYRGGTWLCAASGSDNVSFVKELIYRMTCDGMTMKDMAQEMGIFTNHMEAMTNMAESAYENDLLAGQNHYRDFHQAALMVTDGQSYEQAMESYLLLK